MSAGRFWLLVAGMGVVTYLPRWLPLAILSRRQLPGWLAEGLDLLPPALLAALVTPALFAAGGDRHLDLSRPEALASIPTLLVAVRTRSLAATVVVGMASCWLLEKMA